MSIDLGSQLPMQNKQATPTEPVANNLGSHQLSISNKRMSHMAPALNSPGLPQTPNPNKRMTQMLSMPKNMGSQQSSLLNKRMTNAEPMPINLGSKQSSTSKKRNAQTEPSPKSQAESSESVRAKLRESIADSLALVSKQQNQAARNNSQYEAATTLKPGNENPHLTDISSTSTDISSCNIPVKASKDDDSAQKANSSQSSLQEALANDSKGEAAPNFKSVGQDFQFNYVLLDEDVSLGNDFFVKDELLQGNGLCWVSDLDVQADQTQSAKRPKLIHDKVDGDEKSDQSQDLATRIEAELFKLYGGVNKKYKEKGRSLLFNLKDHNNPELRERVISGDIAPERLCSMTAEELASKELSEWRIAKAEEFAQMVVLPDSGVDVRRLVKKTHKGEFQVEFEQDDGASVEVAMVASSLSHFRPKINELEAHAASKPVENVTFKASTHEMVNSEDQSLQSSLTTLPDDGTDLMQGLMVDELRDVELPPIVSLDEFMESLDSEPPFENLPIDSGTANLNSDEKDGSDVSKLESSDHGSKDIVVNAPDKLEKPEVKSTGMDTKPTPDHINGEPETSTTVVTPKSDSEPNHSYPESEKSTIVSTLKQEHVWEGLLQLNVSSMVTVIGNFKSGERTSAKEWTSFLDVKGRCRLEPFEKFLQELPMSRTRAIMIVHFCWKEGSPESGRVNLCEVVDSYVADERVGFAEPAPGVELYLCPPRGKIYEMLGKHLSKDHIETLNAINDGLVGIVVWRKAHVTSTISPNSSSHHKHNAKKQHSSSVRRQQEKNANTNIYKNPPLPQEPPPLNPEPPLDDESIDDIPPGFGPAAVAARDEDDLPEFDFARGSNSSVSHFSATNPTKGTIKVLSQTLVLPPPRPVDQMRELIHKYGHGEMTNRVDDDDDIPEWQPQSLNQPIAPPQQQLPLPLPPALPTSHPPLAPQMVHSFQQPNLPPQMSNQSQRLPPMQQFTQYPNLHLEHAQPVPMQHMQSMNMLQVQQNVINPWVQGASWPPQVNPHGPPVHSNGLIPNVARQQLEGQFFVTGGQNGVEWSGGWM